MSPTDLGDSHLPAVLLLRREDGEDVGADFLDIEALGLALQQAAVAEGEHVKRHAHGISDHD